MSNTIKQKPQYLILIERLDEEEMVSEFLIDDLESLQDTLSIYGGFIKGLWKLVGMKDELPELQKLKHEIEENKDE